MADEVPKNEFMDAILSQNPAPKNAGEKMIKAVPSNPPSKPEAALNDAIQAGILNKLTDLEKRVVHLELILSASRAKLAQFKATIPAKAYEALMFLLN